VADEQPNLTPTLLFWALGIQLLLGGLLIWQASTGFALFGGHDGSSTQTAPPAKSAPAAAAGGTIPQPKTNRFDAPAAMTWARRQVALGPRPAGSPAQRAAGDLLVKALPGGHFVDIGGGLRNIEGELPGTGKPILLVAHYDTTPVPGYLGANNSAAGVGAVIEIAKALQRDQKPTDHPIRFLLTDGEEAPTYPVEGEFYDQGLRGSRAAAQTIDAQAVIVLDFIAQKGLSIPRESGSDPDLWNQLRAAARKVGAGSVFPDDTRSEIQDDHTPFARAGMPAIDLIDFDYPCWQKTCDTMSQLSTRSLDAAGESVLQLIRELRKP
jgi:glutaminyl-peptide cyclotransferase